MQGIHLLVGIILARLLLPRQFGLIGMITILIAISQSFVDSGFGKALIRKKTCTQTDYSTVFYFNLAVSLFFYLLLFFGAPAVSSFYNEPQLKSIIQILGIGIIINSFSIVQRTQLIKLIEFKLQTKISILVAIGSGIVSIIMAFSGFGVWSLITGMLVTYTLRTLLLWFWNKWKPSPIFSVSSFKEMFSFGSKLLIISLIDTIYRNVYLLIIGKYFSATELGYYTRADQFKKLPSQNIYKTIQRVSYPVLSTIQDDIPKLKAVYQRLIRSTMFITFILMMGLAAVAKPMILTLIGEKWLPSVIYLQLLCFGGMLYPLHAINLNMLQVLGRTDLFLRLEIVKKILSVPVIIIGVSLGIKAMIIGMIFLSYFSYFINSYYSGKHIGYTSFQQIKDIFPSFLFAAITSAIVFIEGQLLNTHFSITFIIQLMTGSSIVFILAETIKFNDYMFIRNIVLEKINKNIIPAG